MGKFKCEGYFGDSPNEFDLGTPDNPFFQGTTPSLTVTVLDSAGVPVNISGATIYLTAKADPLDADPGLFQLSTTNAEIVISPQSGDTIGQYVATFPATATKNLSALLHYLYDSRIILAGNVQTVLFGELTLTQAITTAVS